MIRKPKKSTEIEIQQKSIDFQLFRSVHKSEISVLVGQHLEYWSKLNQHTPRYTVQKEGEKGDKIDERREKNNKKLILSYNILVCTVPKLERHCSLMPNVLALRIDFWCLVCQMPGWHMTVSFWKFKPIPSQTFFFFYLAFFAKMLIQVNIYIISFLRRKIQVSNF